jgi:hypothetical protein
VTIVDRVTERLALAPFEELFRERDVNEAGTFLRLSKPDVYRKVASGVLGHLKVDGAQRRGRGQAGRVSFLLEHLVRYQVERERVASVPIQKVLKTKAPADQAGANGETKHAQSTT